MKKIYLLSIIFLIVSIQSIRVKGVVNGTGVDGTGETHPRLLLVSSAVEDGHILAEAAKEGVVVISYNAQTTSRASLLDMIRRSLKSRKAASIALTINESATSGFYFTGINTVSPGHPLDNPEQEAFWRGLGVELIENGRIDVLNCGLAANKEGQMFIATIEKLSGKHVAASIDFTGHPGIGGNWILETHAVDAAEIYFNPHKLARYTGLLDIKARVPGIDNF